MAFVCLLLAACAGGRPEVTAAEPGVFAELLSVAQVEGATDQQIEALRKANERGEMTFEDISALYTATYDCFDSAGVPYTVLDPLPTDAGLLLPNFVTMDMPGMSVEESDSIVSSCSRRNYGYAQAAYLTQPSAQEALDAAFEADRPRLVECLRSHGFMVADDASRSEVGQLLYEDAIKTHDSGSSIPSCAVS